jgi:hypothetical protein
MMMMLLSRETDSDPFQILPVAVMAGAGLHLPFEGQGLTKLGPPRIGT